MKARAFLLMDPYPEQVQGHKVRRPVRPTMQDETAKIHQILQQDGNQQQST